jgi:hypothetical protein
MMKAVAHFELTILAMQASRTKEAVQAYHTSFEDPPVPAN